MRDRNKRVWEQVGGSYRNPFTIATALTALRKSLPPLVTVVGEDGVAALLADESRWELVALSDSCREHIRKLLPSVEETAHVLPMLLAERERARNRKRRCVPTRSTRPHSKPSATLNQCALT